MDHEKFLRRNLKRYNVYDRNYFARERNIVSSIYAKLHAPDRAAAIIRAREAGLGRG